MDLVGGLCTYPLRKVESSNAQRPEATEHGEDSEAQVITRRDDDEVVLALTVAGAIGL